MIENSVRIASRLTVTQSHATPKALNMALVQRTRFHEIFTCHHQSPITNHQHNTMQSRYSSTISGVSICLALLVSATLHAAEAPAKSPPRIDPQAMAHLQRMSNSLAAAKAFTYKSVSAIEVPAKSGQFLTLFSSVEVALKRPDKLRVRLTGEAPHFDFYYNGATVSAYAAAAPAFSTLQAPPTIDLMLSGLEQETGIRFASMPLLFSDPYRALSRGVSSAIVAGNGRVHGEPCVHLAFKSPGVNWEIWLEEGSRALPRRLATTFTDRPNSPRTIVEFSRWNLHPWLTAGSFKFQAPKGTPEIPFATVMKPTAR